MPLSPKFAGIATVAVAASLVLSTACSRKVRKVEMPPGASPVEELWQAPEDIASRDLYYGHGGEALAPRDTTFAFVSKDTTGFSPGYTVRDATGTEWSAKLGPEAQTEVVSSRILWAIGFHQPPTYYLDGWTLTGIDAGPKEPARMRPTLPTHTMVGDWSWYENPFVGTRQFGGLVAANLILNSWDWKTSNNKIYSLKQPVNGASRIFVVRDLGASLGKTSYPAILKFVRLRGFGQGTRNDLPGFEEQGFIKQVREDGTLEFDYSGIYRDVIDIVTTADVRWTCELMSKISDKQWDDAFRAGGFSEDQRVRYIRKIKEKIAQGLGLPEK